MHTKLYSRHFLAALTGIVAALIANVPVHASPLNLAQSYPDLYVPSVPITFNAGTRMFTASGSYGLLAITSATGSRSYLAPPTGTTFDFLLTAKLNGDGSLLSGSLTISGGASLLSASLTNFGAGTTTDPVFEFTGNEVAGELATQYPNFKSGLGIIMNTADSGSYFTGSFTKNFTATAQTDLFPHPVPIPAAAWLFGSGLIGLVAVSRGNRRRQ